jgi:signal transduction histidine kinase
MLHSNLKEAHSLQPVSNEVDGYLLILHTIDDIELFPAVALESILAVTGAVAGSFFVWNETEKGLVLKSAQGPYRDRVPQSQVRLRDGILGWVGVQGSSVLVKDIAGDERFHSFKRSGQYRSSSFMSIPLSWNNQLLGVVNITERGNLAAFSEEDYKTARSFAAHIAVAYHRLKKSSRIKKENEDFYQTALILKRQLKEQQPLVSVGKLALNLTHELNNPLDAIRRYVNLSLEQSLEHTLTREYLLKAKGGIRRAIRVIRHLMHYAAAHKPAFKTVEIHEIIKKSLDSISQDSRFKAIKIEKRLCDIPSRVLDHGLHLVLQNLYENACHAMKDEGVLTVETRREQDQIVIRVADTGHGVSEEIRSRLFEPFFSTKNHDEGIGMGLSICKEVVERSGGTMGCESISPRGTCFVITLPCAGRGEL